MACLACFMNSRHLFCIYKSSCWLQQLRRGLPVSLCPRWSFFSGQTSLFWVSELILKTCTARTCHLSGWVFCVKLGVLNSLWEPLLFYGRQTWGANSHIITTVIRSSSLLLFCLLQRSLEVQSSDKHPVWHHLPIRVHLLQHWKAIV